MSIDALKSRYGAVGDGQNYDASVWAKDDPEGFGGPRWQWAMMTMPYFAPHLEQNADLKVQYPEFDGETKVMKTGVMGKTSDKTNDKEKTEEKDELMFSAPISFQNLHMDGKKSPTNSAYEAMHLDNQPSVWNHVPFVSSDNDPDSCINGRNVKLQSKNEDTGANVSDEEAGDQNLKVPSSSDWRTLYDVTETEDKLPKLCFVDMKISQNLRFLEHCNGLLVPDRPDTPVCDYYQWAQKELKGYADHLLENRRQISENARLFSQLHGFVDYDRPQLTALRDRATFDPLKDTAKNEPYYTCKTPVLMATLGEVLLPTGRLVFYERPQVADLTSSNPHVLLHCWWQYWNNVQHFHRLTGFALNNIGLPDTLTVDGRHGGSLRYALPIGETFGWQLFPKASMNDNPAHSSMGKRIKTPMDKAGTDRVITDVTDMLIEEQTGSEVQMRHDWFPYESIFADMRSRIENDNHGLISLLLQILNQPKGFKGVANCSADTVCAYLQYKPFWDMIQINPLTRKKDVDPEAMRFINRWSLNEDVTPLEFVEAASILTYPDKYDPNHPETPLKNEGEIAVNIIYTNGTMEDDDKERTARKGAAWRTIMKAAGFDTSQMDYHKPIAPAGFTEAMDNENRKKLLQFDLRPTFLEHTNTEYTPLKRYRKIDQKSNKEKAEDRHVDSYANGTPYIQGALYQLHKDYEWPRSGMWCPELEKQWKNNFADNPADYRGLWTMFYDFSNGCGQSDWDTNTSAPNDFDYEKGAKPPVFDIPLNSRTLDSDRRTGHLLTTRANPQAWLGGTANSSANFWGNSNKHV